MRLRRTPKVIRFRRYVLQVGMLVTWFLIV